MPTFLPDRFEAGTLNLPGILGLGAGLAWLQETGMDRIRAHELALTERFLTGLAELDPAGERFPVAGRREMQRADRSGLHPDRLCRPRPGGGRIGHGLRHHDPGGPALRPVRHQTLGTYPTGTIRFSFGWWNTEAEVERALEALRELEGRASWN